MPVKSKVKILQNFAAFSEYMNFTFLDIWSNFILISVCNLQVKKFKKFKSYNLEVQLCLVVLFWVAENNS